MEPQSQVPSGLSKPEPSKEEIQRSLDFQLVFNEIVQKVHQAEVFSQVMPDIEKDMLQLLRAERMTVFQKGRLQPELVSKYKSGGDIKEIRVPVSPTSIAGFVAMSQAPLLIEDVYDAKKLKSFHADLSFDNSFDKKSGFRTRSVMVIPIKFKEVVMGVLQVLNHVGGGAFTAMEFKNAMLLATVIGQKFRYELQGTNGPYEHLVLQGKVTQGQLADFEKQAKAERIAFVDLLKREAKLTNGQIGKSLEHYYQVPYLGYDPSIEIDERAMVGLKESYLRKQLWLPLERSPERVVILIDDPTDTQRIMEIQGLIHAGEYLFKVALPEDILRFLGQGIDNADEGPALGDIMNRMQEESVEDEITEVDGSQVDENEATVIQLVNTLILDAYKAGASDIHIEPGKGKQVATVRFRIDGECRPSLRVPASHIRAVVSRIKIMSGLDIAEKRKPQDGKCVVRYKGKPIELRVATVPTVNGESVVMRILAASEPLPLDKLNFADAVLRRTKEQIVKPNGIFLVVGPTGSGKTTTLHSVLGHINTPERKIWTAEDPVEITQPGLQQVQMQPKIGLTFATALRAFLRADPDVIMIGEMRDQETAEAGVEASLTGHLVFSTLHTNSAPETVTRLLDLGIDPINFSDALLGVLAQRLVRTLCGACKEEYQVPEEELLSIKLHYGESYWPELAVDEKNLKLFRAKGCEVCGNSGYKGRTGVHELLIASHAIAKLIYKGASASELKEIALREGMRTLMQDGIRKMLKGQTDLAQVRAVAAEKHD